MHSIIKGENSVLDQQLAQINSIAMINGKDGNGASLEFQNREEIQCRHVCLVLRSFVARKQSFSAFVCQLIEPSLCPSVDPELGKLPGRLGRQATRHRPNQSVKNSEIG
jgi:hypothetical protein